MCIHKYSQMNAPHLQSPPPLSLCRLLFFVALPSFKTVLKETHTAVSCLDLSLLMCQSIIIGLPQLQDLIRGVEELQAQVRIIRKQREFSLCRSVIFVVVILHPP